MKKIITLTALAIAALTVSSVHTNAATTVTNETGTSSMHGLNGQFEHYYTASYNLLPMKTVLNYKSHKITLVKKHALTIKKLKDTQAKKRDARN